MPSLAERIQELQRRAGMTHERGSDQGGLDPNEAPRYTPQGVIPNLMANLHRSAQTLRSTPTIPGKPQGVASNGELKLGPRDPTEWLNYVGPTALGVVKPVGGNWLGTQEGGALHQMLRNLEPKLSGPGGLRVTVGEVAHPEMLSDAGKAELERIRPMSKWVQGPLRKYVMNRMASSDDEIRRLADQGITHADMGHWSDSGLETLYRKRAKAGFVGQGMSEQAGIPAIQGGGPGYTLPPGRAWEAAADTHIISHRAGELKGDGPLSVRRMSDKEWLAKTPNETMVYGLDNDTSNLGFDHLLDVLGGKVARGELRPEKLNAVTVEQAVRFAHEERLAQAAKMAEARKMQMEGMTVHREYPEKGYKWVQLTRPGEFAAESDAMGHSVRGYEPPRGGGSRRDPYSQDNDTHPDWIEASGDSGHSGYGLGGWDTIKRGDAKVYSLRDANGEPHVTVEVAQRPEHFFAENFDATPEGLAELKAAMENYQPRITQIKGKQNAKPIDEYLPFVQDFVKSGKWSDVGDLQNTGLRKWNNQILSDADIMALPEEQKRKVLQDLGLNAEFFGSSTIVPPMGRREYASGGAVTLNPNLAAQGRRYRSEQPFEEGFVPSVPDQTFHIDRNTQLAREARRLELLQAEQAAGEKNPRLPKEIKYTQAKLDSGDPWMRTPLGYAHGGSIQERIHALHLRAGGLVKKTDAFKATPPSKLTNQYKVKV